MNIGITLANSQSEKIWNNGIVQNVLNLYFLFKNIKQHNTFLVDPNIVEQKERIIANINDLILYRLDDFINDINVLFIIGVEVRDDQYEKLKSNGCKIIHYNCGSSFMVDMETVLFKEKETNSRIYRHKPDEVWIIPQNYETNKYYFENLYKVECKSIPFIWSSFFIDNAIKMMPDLDVYYKPSNNPKNVTSFEPNINIVKYSMYNILITEMAYKENKSLMNHFYITNTDNIKDNSLFIDTVKHFDVVNDGIASFEGRYPMPFFLGRYTDIVISHQMYNPLNYAYLDALYLGYPLVHNAYMIKDGGYYYDGFNAEYGKEQLLYALSEHDKNIEEYNKKSSIVLNRYLPTNEDNINTYIKLIEDLFKK